MEKLLQIAKEKADQAEIFYTLRKTDKFRLIGGNLDSTDSSLLYGVALRVIKDGKIGFAYTSNLLDREKLVQQALDSAKEGEAALFDFPKTLEVANLKTHDPRVEQTDKKQLLENEKEIFSHVLEKTGIKMNIYTYKAENEKGIINSSGTNLKEKQSWLTLSYYLPFPDGSSGLSEYVLALTKMELLKNFRLIIC